MKKNIILFFACLLCVSIYAQEEVSEEIANQSVFMDFRIPVRENISESDLRYDGWKTDVDMYTFRCRDGERIRLTLWYLTKGDYRTKGSEFINITSAIDKCSKDDLEYNSPASEDKEEEEETTPEEEPKEQ